MQNCTILKFWSLLLLISITATSFSQTDDVFKIPQGTIVTIDTTEYTAEDFVWFYNEYSRYTTQEDTLNSKVDKYFNEFITYKMKVHEAENLKLDTAKAFKDEFFKYLKITAHEKLYKNADKMREDFIKLEYDRLHWDYEVAHIFIKSNIYDSPSAKQAAKEKIDTIQKEITYAATLPQVTFRECVQKYSDDNLSKEFDGNVGFITAMVSPYEYENAVYNAKVGDMVTARTADGWYLINILDKRPTKGAVDAAIIIIYPNSDSKEAWDSARTIIDTVYNKLTQGIPFDTLSAQYNIHEHLRRTNGVIGLIDNGMPYNKEIKETVFGLEHDGDFSKPIKLPYGYAIVKRRWVLPLPGFEAYHDGYSKRIESDISRNSIIEDYFENRMKEKLHFVENTQELENSLQYIDASILLGRWAPSENGFHDAVLFTIQNENYYRSDFFNYLKTVQSQRLRNVSDKDIAVRMRYNDYVKRRLEFAAMKDLEKNDKDFQYTMQGYHDGLIVYDLIDREVFHYAEEDTTGMKFYYSQHKEDFVTAPRRERVTFTCANEKVLAKVLKLLDRQDLWYNGATKVKDCEKIAYYEQKGMPQMYIINSIGAKNHDDVSVDVLDKILRYPEDVLCDTTECSKAAGICDKIIVLPDEKTITVTYYYIASRQQTIKEAKEQLLIDYRKEIEKQWLKSLQKRHTYTINNECYDQLKNILE